jgi:putative transferase (TIGR04331 family)
MLAEDLDKSFFQSQYHAYKYGFSAYKKKKAKYIDKTKEEIQSLWNYSEIKYHKYVEILAKRLNKLHGVEYSNEFWRRVFSQELLMQITAVHQSYYYASQNFNPNIHTCKILSKKNYNIPSTFEELRIFLNGSNFGQEQLFSLYINFFYPNQYYEFEYNYKNKLKKDNQYLSKFFNLKNFNKKKIFNKIIGIIYNLIFFRTNPTICIIGSFFDTKYFNFLKIKSLGKIQNISIPELSITNSINIKNREIISEIDETMDDFDKFFFFTIKFLLPKYLIEDFFSSVKNMHDCLQNYPSLKYIISEGWLASSSINLFRALAYEESGIKTYYNEHNCFFHPYIGDLVNFQANLVDKYLTMGWDCKSTKFKKTASLFAFTIPLKEKKYDILYIHYPFLPLKTYYQSCYMNAGAAAAKQLELEHNFFNNLPDNILKKILYRDYPEDYSIPFVSFDHVSTSNNYLKKVNYFLPSKLKSETSKEQIASSSLVIMNSLSTAYLESMLMDVPTICLIDNECLLLNEKYLNFFDDLIEAKIIHTTLQSALKHIKIVHINPQKWWKNDKTQNLKDKWLKRNFGEPELMLNYLLNLACSKTI